MSKKFLIILFTAALFLSSSASAQSFVEYYNKGQSELENGNKKGYLENLLKADSLRPNHRVVLFSLARAYSVNEKKDEAIETLEKLASFYASTAILDSTSFENIINEKEWSGLVNKIQQYSGKIESSELAFQLDSKGVHFEGIEYDDDKKVFYLTDIYSGKIYKTDKNGGNMEVFVDLSKAGLWAPMSVKIDPLNNQNLWVVSAAIPVFSGYSEDSEGSSALLLIDKESGEIKKKYFPSEKGHLFGDLIINSKGDVYITDSQMPKIYKLDGVSDELAEEFSHKNWWNLQGIAMSEDESKLYVSDYITGIFVVDLSKKKITPILEKNELLRSTDGLYQKENYLIAIQNGTLPKRITVVKLDPNGFAIQESIRYLDQGNNLLEEPTLGTWVDGDFYFIGNSPWAHYNEDNSPKLENWPNLNVMRLKGTKIE